MNKNISKINVLITVLGAVMASSATVWAADTTAQSSTADRPAFQRQMRHSLGLFAGVGLGYFAVQGNSRDSFEGPQGLISLLAAVPLSRWGVLDVGGGYAYTRSVGFLDSGLEVKGKTKSGYAEISPRYRLGERWQLGPVVSAFFGPGVSMHYLEASDEDSVETAAYGGVKGVYEIPFESFAVRLSAQALTDMTVSGRQNTMTLAGISIGFPIVDLRKNTDLALRDQIATSAATSEQPMTFERQLQSMVNTIRFGTGSAEIHRESKQAVSQLAKFLEENDSEWEEISLRGHTDQRGAEPVNQKLSEMRAYSVKMALIENGLDSEKIESSGYGERRPLVDKNDARAWARNRRVEIGVQ